MDERKAIQQMIREGRLKEEEGRNLLEAFEAAEARDATLREELRHQRAIPRTFWALPIAMLIALGMGLAAGVAGAIFAPPRQQTAQPQVVRATQERSGSDTDSTIARLEHYLRQPSGSAADYRLLGSAYQARYQALGDDVDRQRASAALARADQLERRTAMKGNPVVLGSLFVLVIVAAIVIWMMAMYNGLAKADESINERWAQVETVLQRRLDLIPQLIETVKGYALHERETLIAVTEARARALGILQATSSAAPKSAATVTKLDNAQEDLSNALKKVFALAEQYPDLKANSSFLALQDQLEGTENRIAVERQRYNDAVRTYNTKSRVFPSSVVAGMFGYLPRGYFGSTLKADQPVAVSFK